MVYKVLNGYDPSFEHLFAVDNNSIARGHNFKLKKQFENNNTPGQTFFNNRVVNNWNNLHFDVVNATSINSYKNKLDKCWENRMSSEKYKQIICFSPVTFFLTFSARIAYVPFAFCLGLSQGQI